MRARNSWGIGRGKFTQHGMGSRVPIAARLVMVVWTVLLVLLAGCSDDNPVSGTEAAPAETIGLWQLDRVTEDGIEVNWHDHLEGGAPSVAAMTIEVFSDSHYEMLEKDASGIVLFRETGVLEFNGATVTLVGKAQNGQVIPDRIEGPMNWDVVNGEFVLSGTDNDGDTVVLYFVHVTA